MEAFVKLSPNGLTSPFVRGDAVTVGSSPSHGKVLPGMVPMCLMLAKDLELAEKARTDKARLDEIRKSMEVYEDVLFDR